MKMFENCVDTAEYLVECAEQCPKFSSQGSQSPTKWRSLYSQIQDIIAKESLGEADGEPPFKQVRLTSNPLRSLCSSNKNLNHLILNLFPLDNGYSLMVKSRSGQYIETMALPYEEYEILDYIDNEEIPPMLMQTFENLEVNIFYSGCIITEIRDYRIAAGPKSFDTKYVLLRPTQQTLQGDLNALVNETSSTYRWGNDERLALESCLIMSTSEPLCLDPSPAVTVINNIAQQRKRKLRTHPMRRCIRRNGLNAAIRRRDRSQQEAPDHLKLFDFLQKRKAAKSDQGSTGDIRLPKNVTDLWRKKSVDYTSPSGGIGVNNSAKILTPRPQFINDSDVLEVQQIHLKSEGPNRDVYSLITVMQRPSDMHYFGKLQSNKYFHQSADNTTVLSNSCRFSLGSEQRANLYILQYQELFAEDGRRPATVTVSRPLQPATKYQIPLLQQPWQLEQDKSLYAVGSVNDIPVRHWQKLKVNDHATKTHTLSHQQQHANNGPVAGRPKPQPATNSAQLSAATTPTLNTVTLQPNTQSTFMFPAPNQQLQVVSSNQHPILQSTSSGPSISRVLGQRIGSISADTLNLIASGEGNIYQMKETTSVAAERSSRQSSSQELYSLVSQTANGNQNTSTPVIETNLVGQDEQKQNHSNTVVRSMDSLSNALTQGGSVSLQLPLTMTIPAQQRQQVVAQGKVQLQGKVQVAQARPQLSVQQQTPSGGNKIIRLPVAANSDTSSAGNQQQRTTSINLVGGARNVLNTQQPMLNNIQQIQLSSGSRLSTSTLTISPEIAAQLTAQLNQPDKNNPTISAQQISFATSGTSSPITIVTTANGANLPNTQRTQFRAVSANRAQQMDGQSKPTTITFNPRTQMLTTHLRTGSVQQPVQIVQVGTHNTLQQIPMRSQNHQVILNTIRTVSGDQGNSQQLTLAQQLQQLNGGASNSAKQVRGRKRKTPPEQNH